MLPKGPVKIILINFTFQFLATSGPPSDVKIVRIDGTSIKLTWSRPNDFLTNYDYPFDYMLCVSEDNFISICYQVENNFHHTFSGLKPLTEHFITIRAESSDMSGDAFHLNISTIEAGEMIMGYFLVSSAANVSKD